MKSHQFRQCGCHTYLALTAYLLLLKHFHNKSLYVVQRMKYNATTRRCMHSNYCMWLFPAWPLLWDLVYTSENLWYEGLIWPVCSLVVPTWALLLCSKKLSGGPTWIIKNLDACISTWSPFSALTGEYLSQSLSAYSHPVWFRPRDQTDQIDCSDSLCLQFFWWHLWYLQTQQPGIQP